MKAKHIVHALTCLLALGMVAFFAAHSDAYAAGDPWEAWIDEQTDIVLKSSGETDEARRAEKRASIRAKFSALAAELKKEIASPPQTEDYAILQTVKELRDAYDEDYDQKHQDTTIRVSYTAADTEIFAYDEHIPLAEVDAKYPREAWLQMLLDKGITIENAEAYWEYLFLRDTLVHIERQPHVWSSGHLDIPATEDWDPYKAAYIERALDRIQKRLEEKEDRGAVFFHRFPGNHHSFLEKHDELQKKAGIPGEIFKSFALRSVNIPQTVKALRDAYGEKYNERYAITSGSISHTQDGITIFAYQFPLPMSEVDAKYPRDAWLQMILDKGISVDNFEEYWAYLSQRDTLVALEKQPEVWASGLFGIPATDDWETYKEAYLKQMIGNLHSNKEIVYLGKADDVPEALRKATEHLEKDAAEALKKATEHLEKLEHYRLPSFDR
ncbi:MAG: hypothetical protein OXU36_10240 [Candidatus Poribacteria bacterium]|nr:hypothetical protein [Candidatus Poribacteria bacterium]